MVWILYGHHPWPDRWLFAMLKRQQCYGTPRLRWVGGSGGQHQIEQDLPHKDLELRRSGAGRNNGQFLKMNRKSFHTPDISICIWISGGGVVSGSQFLRKLACQWVGGYLGVSSLSWWFKEWGRERKRSREKRKKAPLCISTQVFWVELVWHLLNFT